ncbi:DUF3592 domain-containing protein [Hymenobacter sp. BT190]|uniref:DUF3592 domain-containing protein n=1 Tax=Hymenobacter sp. BT190 TaxID=2763505 RepID=UPI001651376E|nr:DUF3592 domain-containing protein [Hymenobacter sp. BT190]MBC6699470.1 hypothetical protein [Hymenobacter sp. BT190]
MLDWLTALLTALILGSVWFRVGRESCRLLLAAIQLKRHGIHKTGEVIGFEESADSEGYRYFAPIIVFSYQGKQWQFVSQIGSDEKSLAGTYINIIHDPLTPEVAEVDSFAALFSGPVLGLAVPAIGGLLTVGFVIQKLLT